MTANDVKIVPDLSTVDIKDCIKRFEAENQTSEVAVSSVFSRYNKNIELSEILIKVIVINSCYNARLNNNHTSNDTENVNLPVDVYTISDHFFRRREEIAKYVEDKDKISLIENLKKVGDEYKIAYSFVTKYFYWEYQDMDIYMVDRYVKGVLYYYNKQIQYTEKFTQKDLDNYTVFCSAYDAFFSALHKVNNYVFKSTREKDIFLWMFAKDLEKKKHIKITYE